MSTIDDVSRYLKLRARAEHPTTPDAEVVSARKIMATMELKDPDLQPTAARVASALHGTPSQDVRSSADPWWASILKEGVMLGVQSIGSDPEAAARFDPIAGRGQCVITVHDCGAGQVCVEFRANARDLAKRNRRDRMLDQLEEEIGSEAKRAL
jgi:hypothetical protein